MMSIGNHFLNNTISSSESDGLPLDEIVYRAYLCQDYLKKNINDGNRPALSFDTALNLIREGRPYQCKHLSIR